jgi:tetratricopeptide (TPR) repeat protein
MRISDRGRSDDLNSQLSLWILRPYLDLAPAANGPLHVQCIEEGWNAFADGTGARFVPQRAMPPGFRVQLGQEAGALYALSDPRELPDHLRSDRWQSLCRSLDDWNELASDQKCRLASLLHSMCLYQVLLALIPEPKELVHANEPDDIDLMFWRGSAGFMRKQTRRTSHYQAEDMAAFESIAQNALDLAPVGFNAAAKVFVHKAKTRAPVSELAEWAGMLERALMAVSASMDEFTAGLYTSRFYRALGFLPQRKGDNREVVRVMDLAERHARGMKPANSAQHLLYSENLHALLESRTKEALWIDDKDLALIRAMEVVEIDPFDAKAWAEVGEVRYLRQEWQEAAEAYAAAAMLGPPASAVGRHMAGVCLRKLGQPLLSALLFRDALEIDPLGVSPRIEIRSLPKTKVLEALKSWNDCTVEI